MAKRKTEPQTLADLDFGAFAKIDHDGARRWVRVGDLMGSHRWTRLCLPGSMVPDERQGATLIVSAATPIHESAPPKSHPSIPGRTVDGLGGAV